MHEKGHDKIETIIGTGTIFVGTLQVKGTVRVDGKAEGRIESSGDIVIGEGGLAEAAVQGRNVRVAGTLRGNAKAAGTLEITSTGKLFGDIEVSKLHIGDGAIFQGNCDMKVAFDKEEKKQKQ
jgi:cytoskeletal protein CcmA (bactofilin family)